MEFQARCVGEGLRRLGVERCSIYGISYGGYVAHRVAEMWPGMVEKVVIVSSGVGATEEEIEEHLNKVGRNAVDLLLPETLDDLRRLMDFTMYKFDPFKWVPYFILQDFIDVSFSFTYFIFIIINLLVISFLFIISSNYNYSRTIRASVISK